MAKKSKHKLTQHDLKIIAARHKNEFMGRIKHYVDLWLGEKSFSLVPEKDHEFIYLRRYTIPRIEVEKGVNVSKKFLAEMKDMLEKLLHFRLIEMPNELSKITLYDFLIYYMSIFSYFAYIRKNDYDSHKTLCDRYNFLHESYEKVNTLAISDLNFIMVMLGLFYSYPDKKYYWVSTDFHQDLDHNTGNYWIFRLHETNLQVRNFVLNNEKRPAFKLGTPLPDNGVSWIRVKMKSRSITNLVKSYQVFIQSHALKRLFERLDSLEEHVILYNLYSSFVKPQLLYEKGKLLIEYSLFQKKIGYFIAEVAEGKLLLRTFLFLTNEGTPEARKLQDVAGLGKLDIKYWNIDKLRKFLESDIITNPVVKNIFVEAGCGDLFCLQTTDTDAYKIKEYVADEMQKYMGLNKEENDDDSYESQDDTIPAEEAEQSLVPDE